MRALGVIFVVDVVEKIKDELKGKTAFSYLIFSAYVTLICHHNARPGRVTGFITTICINANTFINTP